MIYGDYRFFNDIYKTYTINLTKADTHVNDIARSLGITKEMIILFSDIRSFTSFSEANEPKRVVDVLNKILSVQAKAVMDHKGDIDNFIGDAIYQSY